MDAAGNRQGSSDRLVSERSGKGRARSVGTGGTHRVQGLGVQGAWCPSGLGVQGGLRLSSRLRAGLCSSALGPFRCGRRPRHCQDIARSFAPTSRPCSCTWRRSGKIRSARSDGLPIRCKTRLKRILAESRERRRQKNTLRNFMKKKLGCRACSVHGRFTPTGFILMTDFVQFSSGGKRAPARC